MTVLTDSCVCAMLDGAMGCTPRHAFPEIHLLDSNTLFDPLTYAVGFRSRDP